MATPESGLGPGAAVTFIFSHLQFQSLAWDENSSSATYTVALGRLLNLSGAQFPLVQVKGSINIHWQFEGQKVLRRRWAPSPTSICRVLLHVVRLPSGLSLLPLAWNHGASGPLPWPLQGLGLHR